MKLKFNCTHGFLFLSHSLSLSLSFRTICLSLLLAYHQSPCHCLTLFVHLVLKASKTTEKENKTGGRTSLRRAAITWHLSPPWHFTRCFVLCSCIYFILFYYFFFGGGCFCSVVTCVTSLHSVEVISAGAAAEAGSMFDTCDTSQCLTNAFEKQTHTKGPIHRISLMEQKDLRKTERDGEKDRDINKHRQRQLYLKTRLGKKTVQTSSS